MESLRNSGTVVTALRAAPASRWAPLGSSLSINSCHRHLQQHQDWVDDYFTEDLVTFLTLE